MAKKRDAAYYRERLRRDHPSVYEELEAGRFQSVRQAAAHAGLIRLPTRLDALKREWSHASPADRRAFVEWVRAQEMPVAPPQQPAPAAIAHSSSEPARARTFVPARPPVEPMVGPDGFLRPKVIHRVESILEARKLRPGGVMQRALTRSWRPNAQFVDRLRAWIEEFEPVEDVPHSGQGYR